MCFIFLFNLIHFFVLHILYTKKHTSSQFQDKILYKIQILPRIHEMIDSSFCPFDSGYFCTFLWSAIPFLELRVSIPLGYLQFGLSIYEAILISSLGCILTASIVLKLLPIFVHFFENHLPIFDRIMKKIFEKTRHEHSHKMAVVGEIFLILFVAIPMPGSGSWSGVLIAYLFGIPYKKAIAIVGLGVLFSALLVSILTIFGHQIWKFFN